MQRIRFTRLDHHAGGMLSVVVGICAFFAHKGAFAAEDVSATGGGSNPTDIVGPWRPKVPTFLFNLAPIFAVEDPESPTPPLIGKYLDMFNTAAARLRRIKAGQVGPGEGRFRATVNCPPTAMPQMMLNGIDLVMTHDPVIYILGGGAVGGGAVRHIYMDGKGQPPVYSGQWDAAHADQFIGDEFVPGYLGHSIGHWEGHTLVVDTIGLVENRIDGQEEAAQATHSDALHIIERIRRVNADTLEDQITLIDPKALSMPWTSVVEYRRAPEPLAAGAGFYVPGEFRYCEEYGSEARQF